MTANKNIRGSVQSACESLVKIQDMLMDSASNAAKSDESTAWQDAETLFQLAKEADNFRRRLASLLGDNSPAAVPELPKSPVAGQRRSRTTAHTDDAPLKKKKTDYPRYLISGNCLVKIGLQRDRRTEYQHIVQKAAFDKIASVITNRMIKAKDFTPESIQTELNLPAYQTYVVLAMLRHTGLLKIPRRGLYTATGVRDFASAASDIWNKLSVSGGGKNDNDKT